MGSYSTTNTAGIALMVKQLRTGMRSNSCPVVDEDPACNAGQRCTPPGYTWGRGMCTTVTGKGNQCLDMCDEALALTAFHDTPGKQAGTVSIVEMVRAGRDPAGLTTCPLPTIWIWLWIPLLTCGAIGLCAGAFYVFKFRSGLSKRGRKGYQEPEPAYADDQAPYVDYQQDYQQEPEFQQDDQQYYTQDQMVSAAAPQTQEQFQAQLEDPMPVVDQGLYEPAAAPAEPNLFDQPGLMAPLTQKQQPSTIVQPMGTMYPGMVAPSAAGGYTTMPQRQATPQYTSQPTYGAYGAYGGATTVAAAYPGTTSMRIG